MIITARYASVCPVCRHAIAEGAQVEWSKGAKAMHPGCAADGAPVKTARKSPSQPRAPKVRRELQAGETEISSRTRGYTVGATVHAAKVAGGGGPDGHYWTVTHEFFVRANEDNGQYDDLHCAYVRAATEAECAPLIARAISTGAKATCETWLATQLAHKAPGVTSVSDTGSLPPASEILQRVKIGHKVSSSGAVVDGGTTYALTADTVVAHHGGYYDDYRSSTRTLARTSELAQVINALATSDAAEIAVCADRIEANK